MWVIVLFACVSVLKQSSGQDFLWDRIFNPDGSLIDSDNNAPPSNLPVDCVKRWGECQYEGPSLYIKEEYRVTRERYGGKCELKTQRYCDRLCRTKPPCRKKVDCVKKWGQCMGNGPYSYKEEYAVSPAKYGGSCKLEREYGCSANKPVDCKKEWGRCEGVGPTSFRTQVEISPAKYGGSCTLKTERGCNNQPEDCEKKWGDCVDAGPYSYRREERTKPERYGGMCNLKLEYGCAKLDPVDCEKEWGPCNDLGEYSYSQEIVISPAKNGGSCDLEIKWGCKKIAEDCKKKWGRCVGTGPDSTRTEVVVTPEKGDGKCELKTEKGCRYEPVHCKKEWGPCIGMGHSSSRTERVKTPARHGGKPCTTFEKEMGCNVIPSEEPELLADDSKGKAAGTLFMQSFIMEAQEGSIDGTRVAGRALGDGAHARSLVVKPTPKAKVETVTYERNGSCWEARAHGKVVGKGCVTPFLESVIKEVDAETNKRGKSLTRRQRMRRSTPAVGNPFTRKPRDVLFLLDSSGSVGPYNFDVMKEIAKATVDLLCDAIALGEQRTRIALATFNARQQIAFPFTKTSSPNEVKLKIKNTRYDYVYSYQSCIKEALNFVVRKVYTDDNFARDPKVAEGDMIMMTDGCANCDFSYQNVELQKAAYRLKVNAINVYVVGIGIEENCRKILQVLARGGRCFHFFYLDNWDVDVEQFLQRLKNPPQNRCLDRWEFPGINCLAP